MDSLLEVVIFIVVGIVYTLWNFITNREDNEPGSSAAPHREREPSNRDPEFKERQRRIQEEIRRKIEERRGGSAASRTPPPIRQQQAPVSRRDLETPPPVPTVSLEKEEKPELQHNDFSWDVSDNVYATQMEERLREIEKTKQRAAAMKHQVKERGVEASAQRRRGSRPRSGGLGAAPVRETLTGSKAARAALVYAEVLGQPVALRKSSSHLPGLS